MPKQVYDIQALQDAVRILKNGDLVYDVSIKSKSINLAELYANMKVDLND
jgi:ABC-type Na+ transport system ATPase subunit NatA